MRKGSKIISVLALTILMVNLLGCNNKFSSSENSSTSEQEKSISVEETTIFTEEITDEELEKIHSDVNIIIQSLNDRDIKKVKTVFSDITLQKITLFDERMEYVFDMFDGEIVKSEKYEIVKLDSGSFLSPNFYSIRASYDIYTETKKYILDVRYKFQGDIQPVDAGVYSIEILDFDRTHEYYVYGRSITHVIPGVFSSEIQTIEFNRDELSSNYGRHGLIIELADGAAIILNKAGVEKIRIEKMDVDDGGVMTMTLVDETDCKYFVKTDEGGEILFVFENDMNGRKVFYRL